MTTKIIILILITWLTSCQRQSSLTVNLKNYSKDNPAVNLKVVVGDVVVYDNKLVYNADTNVYTTIIKDIPIGKYSITATADSVVEKTHPIMADLDRTINIRYYYNSIDTITETLPYGNDSVTVKRHSNKRDAKLDILLLHDK